MFLLLKSFRQENDAGLLVLMSAQHKTWRKWRNLGVNPDLQSMVSKTISLRFPLVQ